jgi:outer membrane protein TolC
LTRAQAAESLANMGQLAELDVRSAYEEIRRAREGVAATALLVARRADALRAETEKFGVNKTTALLVAQAQRDLLAARIQEVQAVVDYLKSFIALYRVDGTLLERRGIVAPGRDAGE